MRRLALLVFLAVPGAALACGGDGVLEDAVTLVMARHPVLVAERGSLAEHTRQRDWSADLSLGYAQKGTADDAAGANAALRVSIPLVGRARELAAAKARAGLVREETRVLAAFLDAVETLCVQAAKVRELETLKAFYGDRLGYRREQVDEGLAEADTLWPEVEQAQRTGHELARESGRLEAMRLAAARGYGGSEWKILRDLLVAMAR